MKLLFENWRKYLTEVQDSCPDDVYWHGTSADFEGNVRASQAHDHSENPCQNENAVYAFKTRDEAVLAGLVEGSKDNHWGKVFLRSNVEWKLVIVNAEIRKGQQIYLYKLPGDGGQDGIPFEECKGTGDEKTGKGIEYISTKPKDWNEEANGPYGITPCGKEVVSVDDWLHLTRYAEKEDLEWYKQYDDVTEEDLEFLRSKGSDV